MTLCKLNLLCLFRSLKPQIILLSTCNRIFKISQKMYLCMTFIVPKFQREIQRFVFQRHNIRDAHGKDFRPIFDHFSLQFLFNFTANLTFFAVKLKENWNENGPKIGYRECPGRVILEKRVKIGSKAEPEGVQLTGWNGTPSCRR